MLNRILGLALVLLGAASAAHAQYTTKIITVSTPASRTAAGSQANFEAAVPAMIQAANTALTASGVTNETYTSGGIFHSSKDVFDKVSPAEATRRAWQEPGAIALRDSTASSIVIVVKKGTGAAAGTEFPASDTGGESWQNASVAIDWADLGSGGTNMKYAYETAAGYASGARTTSQTAGASNALPQAVRTKAPCPTSGSPGSGCSTTNPPATVCYHTLGGKPVADGVTTPCAKAYVLSGTNYTCSKTDWCDYYSINVGAGHADFTPPFYGVLGVNLTTTNPTCNAVGWWLTPNPQKFSSILGVAQEFVDVGLKDIGGSCPSGWQVAPQFSNGTGVYQGGSVGGGNQSAATVITSKASTVSQYGTRYPALRFSEGEAARAGGK